MRTKLLTFLLGLAILALPVCADAGPPGGAPSEVGIEIPGSLPTVEPVLADPLPAPAVLIVPAAPAPVEAVASPTAGEQVFDLLLPTAGAVLSLLAGWLLLGLRRRLGLEIADAHAALIRGTVRRAIAGAEEWAAREGGRGGLVKSAHAIAAVRVQYPKLPPSSACRLLDEELGSLPGMGASGDRAVLLPPSDLAGLGRQGRA